MRARLQGGDTDGFVAEAQQVLLAEALDGYAAMGRKLVDFAQEVRRCDAALVSADFDTFLDLDFGYFWELNRAATSRWRDGMDRAIASRRHFSADFAHTVLPVWLAAKYQFSLGQVNCWHKNDIVLWF
jgi:hypothetical protein